MRVELRAGRRLLGRQAGGARGWRALVAVLAGLGLAIIGQGGAGAQTGLVTVEPDCIEPGRARYGLDVQSTHDGPVTGTVRSSASGESLNTYEIAEPRGTIRTAAPVGEKRLTFITTTPDGLTDTDQVEAQDCGTTTTTVTSVTVTSTTVAAGATGGASGTGGTTATPAAPPSAPASSAQPSLLSAAGQPASALPAAVLATTGSPRVEYWMRLAAASLTLGLVCMFITQRRRFRRIDAWLSYVFNNF